MQKMVKNDVWFQYRYTAVHTKIPVSDLYEK